MKKHCENAKSNFYIEIQPFLRNGTKLRCAKRMQFVQKLAAAPRGCCADARPYTTSTLVVSIFPARCLSQ